MSQSKINSFYTRDSSNGSEKVKRIRQGDLLRDFSFKIVDVDNSVKELTFSYLFVMSQDCDLLSVYRHNSDENSSNLEKNNNFLPNILLVPGFLEHDIKSGHHLKDVFNITQRNLPTDEIKKIKQNQTERYHFLRGDNEKGVPDLITDFKLYTTVNIEVLSEKHGEFYLATISELFRERFSQRFSNYFSRIGLPEI